MKHAEKIDPSILQKELAALPGWAIRDEAIEKDFEFGDFNEAFGFLTRVALLSERMDHHAEWSGVYNKVKIRLSTHDAGGITAKDIKMAAAIHRFTTK